MLIRYWYTLRFYQYKYSILSFKLSLKALNLILSTYYTSISYIFI